MSVTMLRVALAQLNLTVGDLDGNLARLSDAYDRAEAAGCDIVAFPELSTTGYPPEDLVLKPGFVVDNLDVLAKLAARTKRCAAVVGFVDQDREREFLMGQQIQHRLTMAVECVAKGPDPVQIDPQRQRAPGHVGGRA